MFTVERGAAPDRLTDGLAVLTDGLCSDDRRQAVNVAAGLVEGDLAAHLDAQLDMVPVGEAFEARLREELADVLDVELRPKEPFGPTIAPWVGDWVDWLVDIDQVACEMYRSGGGVAPWRSLSASQQADWLDIAGHVARWRVAACAEKIEIAIAWIEDDSAAWRRQAAKLRTFLARVPNAPPGSVPPGCR